MSLDRLVMRTVILDRRSRAVLRESLMSVVYKGEVDHLSDIKNAVSVLKADRRTEIVFLDFAIGRQAMATFIDGLKTAKLLEKLGIIVTVGRSGNDMSSRVVEMYLEGIDGFIHEPYSSENLKEVLTTVVERVRKRRLEARVRALKAIDFLAQDAARYVDEIALKLREGQEAPLLTQRSLKTTSESLAPLFEEYPEDFAQMLARSFGQRQPFEPLPERERLRKSNQQKAPHPGMIVQELMNKRKLSSERILPSMRITPEEFEKLLACQLVVSDQIARELSRVLGKTVKEWLNIQKRWDSEAGQDKQ